MPIFDLGFLGLSFWGLKTGGALSGSDPDSVSVDADDDMLEAFAGRSGDGDDESCRGTATGLLFIHSKAPSSLARGFELDSLLRIGAGDELEELD